MRIVVFISTTRAAFLIRRRRSWATRDFERLGVEMRSRDINQEAPAWRKSRNWLAVALVQDVRPAAKWFMGYRAGRGHGPLHRFLACALSLLDALCANARGLAVSTARPAASAKPRYSSPERPDRTTGKC